MRLERLHRVVGVEARVFVVESHDKTERRTAQAEEPARRNQTWARHRAANAHSPSAGRSFPGNHREYTCLPAHIHVARFAGADCGIYTRPCSYVYQTARPLQPVF